MPSDGLFIAGLPGTGKTHLASGLVRAAVEMQQAVQFVRCADLYAEIRRSYSNTGEATETIESQYAAAQLLVLDDLAAGSLSDHERRTALNILDVRLNNLRPTVVTSNLPLQQIGTDLDERIASRLRGFTPVVLGGRDRRSQASTGRRATGPSDGGAGRG